MGNVKVTSATIQLKDRGAPPWGSVGLALSGGDAAFGWVAPDGLSNGKTLLVSSDSLTFAAPDKQVYLGYGMGWLYDNPDGTTMPVSIPVDSESINYEYAATPYREIKTIGDQKYIHSLLRKSADNLPSGAGSINWDTGSNLLPRDVAFQFSRSRCVVGVSPESSLQWKQDRVGFQPNLGSTPNSYYPRSGPSVPSVGAGSFNGYDGSGVATVYYGTTPVHNSEWSSFAWSWDNNTPDQQDGMISYRCLTGASPGFNRGEPSASGDRYSTGTITTDTTDRPRWIKRQDYIGNNATARDVEIDITDLYWKLNGDLWLLADSADLDLCVEEPIPLVPVGFNGSGEVTLNLWRGAMISFTGKYLHRLDGRLNILNTVSL